MQEVTTVSRMETYLVRSRTAGAGTDSSRNKKAEVSDAEEPNDAEIKMFAKMAKDNPVSTKRPLFPPEGKAKPQPRKRPEKKAKPTPQKLPEEKAKTRKRPKKKGKVNSTEARRGRVNLILIRGG